MHLRDCKTGPISKVQAENRKRNEQATGPKPETNRGYEAGYLVA